MESQEVGNKIKSLGIRDRTVRAREQCSRAERRETVK